MAAESAGILLYRRGTGELELLLIHPGGPFWRGRDEGAWMIPKGAIEAGETAEAAALREFEEELGTRPEGALNLLGRIRQKGGKWVTAFAAQGDLDTGRIVSNAFRLEFPPKSGEWREFPEVDEARWFTPDEAKAKILPSQAPILAALEALIAGA